LRRLERWAAASRRFGGAEVDPARFPRLDLPPDVERAVDAYELSAEPDRPGPLVQVARALGLVARQGSVEDGRAPFERAGGACRSQWWGPGTAASPRGSASATCATPR